MRQFKKIKNKIFRIDEVLVLTSVATFMYYFAINFMSDIQLHSKAVQQINLGQSSYPSNFIYYLILNTFSFFSTDINMIVLTSCFILSFTVLLKYIVTKKILKSCFIRSNIFIAEKKLYLIVACIACCLILFYPIQDFYGAIILRKYYYGKIVPNIWHNPTTMSVFPFAILLFWKQLKVLESDKPISGKAILTIIMLIVINIFIKPSFFIVFTPVTLIFILKKHKLSVEFIKNTIPIITGLILLYFMHKMIYTLDLGNYNNSSGKIALAKPFEAWTYFVPLWYIPISFVHSLALPILYIILYRKEVFKNKMINYSLILTVFGFLISIFLIEEGSRKFHGNFMWQNIICSYLLIMSISAAMAVKFFTEERCTIKFKVLSVIFILHALSGIIYIIKMFVTGSPA